VKMVKREVVADAVSLCKRWSCHEGAEG